MALWLILVTAMALSTPAEAGVICTQGFEDLNNGKVDGQGLTWYANRDDGFAYARVVDDASMAHSGNKFLRTHQHPYYGMGINFGWYDDDATAPHGDLLELSFWMHRNADALWQMNGYAWNSETIFSLANLRNGSPSTIDVMTSGETWEETLAIVPSDTWRQVFIQMDFDESTVQYRVKAGGSNWQGWFDSGVEADYFRYFEFTYGRDNVTDIWFDDMALSTVPEPATMFLLGLGGLILRKR